MEFICFLGVVGLVAIGAAIWAQMQIRKQKRQSKTSHS